MSTTAVIFICPPAPDFPFRRFASVQLALSRNLDLKRQVARAIGHQEVTIELYNRGVLLDDAYASQWRPGDEVYVSFKSRTAVPASSPHPAFPTASPQSLPPRIPSSLPPPMRHHPQALHGSPSGGQHPRPPPMGYPMSMPRMNAPALTSPPNRPSPPGTFYAHGVPSSPRSPGNPLTQQRSNSLPGPLPGQMPPGRSPSSPSPPLCYRDNSAAGIPPPAWMHGEQLRFGAAVSPVMLFEPHAHLARQASAPLQSRAQGFDSVDAESGAQEGVQPPAGEHRRPLEDSEICDIPEVASNPDVFCDDGVDWGHLSREVETFVQAARPSQQEILSGDEVVRRIAVAARELWPGSEVHLFGSRATGLSLAGGDLDLVILGVVDDTHLGGGGFSKDQRKLIAQNLRKLRNRLLKKNTIFVDQAFVVPAR
ncbi:hypothetical protein CYMTET_30622, partial [Cymbomonas tetramitiformis]